MRPGTPCFVYCGDDACNCIAHPRHNAPQPGEIRIINGIRHRFIERELEGDKWEIIDP